MRAVPVSQFPPVEITVYSYECDAFGHLNQAAYLQVFERARWEILARGPGADLFERNKVWPAVRRATVDYLLPAFPGDLLKVDAEVEKLGETSLEMRQRAVRAADGKLLAELYIVFVMIDREGRPKPIPAEIVSIFRPRGSRTVEVVRHGVGGDSLAAEVRGDGPALLLIHGFPLDHTMWAHQFATLKGWRRIAPDLRGCGLSNAPGDDCSMATYADDLVRLLDQMQVKKAVVAGLSLGGYVAFELLRRYRDRVAGLILLDTRADADTAEGRASRETLIEVARKAGPGAVGERMLPRLLGRTTQRTQPHLVPQVKEMAVRWSVPGMVGALGAMRDRPDSTALLQTVDVPTLVVVGERDAADFQAIAQALARGIPGARRVVVPGVGHLPCLEAPAAFAREVLAFLAPAAGA